MRILPAVIACEANCTTKRRRSRLRRLLLSALCCSAMFATTRAAERPNIILCMADDQGWGDTGYNGHPFARTPHLDQMAGEGLRFDRWYAAAPVCSPTRGSCLTGRHPYRYGVYSANVGCLRRGEICLAEVLKERGYATGHFGKWHLGTLTTRTRDANRGGPESAAIYSPPWENGFDVCFSTESKVPTYNPTMNPPSVSREVQKNASVGSFYGTHYWTGPDQPVSGEMLHGDDSQLIMDRAIPFIDGACQAGKPFFAVIWFHATHTPVVADEQHRALYPNHPHGIYGQHYHGCLTALDEQIGRLRARLAELGVAENTMLWYSADNGPESTKADGAGTAGILRGRKRSLYEGGIRVPGILVWPARLGVARRTSVPCVSSDYFPTILDALDVDLPDRPYDGISLLPLLDGSITSREKPIGFQSGKQRALVTERYKLYSSNDGASWELYDLENDPGETKNLAATEPARVREMSKTLTDWVASCRASDAGGDYR